MGTEYALKVIPEGWIVESRTSGYELRIENWDGNYDGNIVFKIPSLNPKYKNYPTHVTDRDVEGYRRYPQSPGFQYIEIAAGLGGFIPHMVRRYGKRLKNSPIVIDPVSYETMDPMLSFALDGRMPENVEARLRILLDRCSIYMDKQVIRHIELPVHDAIEKHPEIHHLGDVVVHNWAGADLWGEQMTDDELFRKYSFSEIEQILKK